MTANTVMHGTNWMNTYSGLTDGDPRASAKNL
jgi:hypothetical protein